MRLYRKGDYHESICRLHSDEYNQALSIRRAEAVKAHLISRGVGADRVYTEGQGERQAIADNSTSEGREKNRRVIVEVVGSRR